MNKKLLHTLFFTCCLFVFFSCDNLIDVPYNYIEETEATKPTQKAYIVFNLVENGRSAARTVTGTTGLPKQGISTGVTSSLFSDITFSGSLTGSSQTISRTASSFAQLSGQTIEVEAGEWTFTLEAWLGKTDTNPGEKYVSTQTLDVHAGDNELKMSLVPDSASTISPASHPGSWQVQVKFPCDDDNLIDSVNVWLINYSDFANAGSDISVVTKQFTQSYTKGTDFTATGLQTLTVGETSRACGNYVVYVRFLKNVVQQGGTSSTATVASTEIINTWGELMRINPGATATGTITLPSADKVYTITYNIGNAEWDTTSTDYIQISYTKSTNPATGTITLPGESAFVNRNPSTFTPTDSNRPYQLLGWYENPQFTGPAVTTFAVTDGVNKTFYAKWKEPLFDVYISSGGHDDTGDGSLANPLKTAKAAYDLFGDLSATNADGSFRNTIHILTDYTGTNKIAEAWGDGSKHDMYVNFVGEKGGVANSPVTLELDTHNCGPNGEEQTFIYLENNQRMKFSHINFTSNQTYAQPNGYACLSSTDTTQLYFENSTITGYVAKGCCGINVEGEAWFKNCEISGNYAIDADPNSSIWACAVNASTGILHLGQGVVIKSNTILKDDGSGNPETDSYNLYVGTYESGSLTFNELVIDEALTGSEIWLKLAQEPRAFTTGYTSSGSESHNTAEPSTYFHSDSGLDIELNASQEAVISLKIYIYVSSDSESPAGNDGTGTGSQDAPYLTIGKAIDKITSFNNNLLDAVIYVKGDVGCNTIITDDGGAGPKLVAQSLKIQGRGTGPEGDWKTAAAQTILNGDTDGDGTGDGAVLLMNASVPLTLKNLTLKNGSSSSTGGALCYDGTEAVTIDSCIICDNTAVDYGGALAILNSEITLTNTEIYNNKVTGTTSDYGQGGGVYIRNGILTLDSSVSLKSNFASRYGGAITLGTNGLASMNGGTIEGNGALKQGGGVYVSSTAVFEMNTANSLIKNNGIIGKRPTTGVNASTRTSGGGVNVAAGGSFTMNGGEISGNICRSGAGLYVKGTATLNAGTITLNKKIETNANDCDLATSSITDLTTRLTSLTTNYVANVEVGILGTFDMYGGTITQPEDSSGEGQNGAGVNLYGHTVDNDPAGTATFNMYDGSITGLKVNGSAAVAMNTNVENTHAKFNMYGGSITGITAGDYSTIGGAVYVGENGEFTMTGGEISGNHPKATGSAVYLDPAYSSSSITLGVSGLERTILIKDNTTVNTTQKNNLSIPSDGVIVILGPLSSSSEVGITRAGDFSATPFTYGFNSSNGTAPADIFTSDEGYTVIAGSGGEAAFMSSSANGTVYTPDDYNFTLTASRSTVTVGRAATVTVTPDITRTEPVGSPTPLFYNPADHKLYLDSVFTQPEGSNAEVTWTASLWCHGSPEYDSLTAVTGTANAHKFTIPALTFEETYNLNVTATYQGYTHNANLPLQCQAAGPLSIPLTLEAVSSAATVTFRNRASGSVTYSVNGGELQTIAANGSKSITLDAAGDKVEFFGDNTKYGSSSTNASYSSNISCSADCYVYGNIMSLVNSTEYEIANALSETYTFAYLFKDNSKIKNKTGVELLLPATTLADYCYDHLFMGCTSLTTAPVLPATTLASYCYHSMFNGCTSLTTAPELPATTLTDYCYQSMFNGCTSLTSAPELPATVMKQYCYAYMFYGCTSLTTAPVLPATTLVNYCYFNIFSNCTSLNNVTCLATSISANCATRYWLLSVASNGTFTKAASATWPSGYDGIPEGWTVQDAP